MIFLEPKEAKNQWYLICDSDVPENQPIKVELELFAGPSIVKKFGIVNNVLIDMSSNIPEFSNWFYNMVKSYIDSDYNAEEILNNVDQFVSMSTIYVDSKGINFEGFVDKTKTTKTSIIFTADDIRELAIASNSLKLYAIFSNDTKMKLPENIHRRIYDILIKGCSFKKDGITSVTDKIFQLIRSRIYRSSVTDKYMWDLIRMSISDTPETYVMTVFNFLMINLLSMLSLESNPVHYLVSIADYKVQWLMRGVYKEKIIYGEAFSGTDDVFGSSQSQESLHLFCCNDTIGKCAKFGMDVIESQYNPTEDEFENIRTRLDNIKNVSPSMQFFTLPIASKVLEVPYKYLLTTPAKHIALIGVFLYHISKNILDNKYPILNEFLIACPVDNTSVITKSYYQIKHLEFIVNCPSPIFEFHSSSTKHEIISPICGILTTVKRNLISIIDGKKLVKIGYNLLENDVVNFYTDLYSGELEPIFEKMREKMDMHF